MNTWIATVTPSPPLKQAVTTCSPLPSSDLATLVQLWRDSVDAQHHFFNIFRHPTVRRRSTAFDPNMHQLASVSPWPTFSLLNKFSFLFSLWGFRRSFSFLSALLLLLFIFFQFTQFQFQCLMRHYYVMSHLSLESVFIGPTLPPRSPHVINTQKS